MSGRFDERIDTADAPARPQPLALMAARSEQVAYPVEALGDVLGSAVAAVTAYAYVSPCIAAQSALSACSLATQAYFNVRLPTGQERPISLNLVTVADSGDRKSTSDDMMLEPIREFEAQLEEIHASQKMDAGHAQSAWDEAKKAATQRNKNQGRAALEEAYRELGPRPEGPVDPTIIVRTGTTQALLKRFVQTRPSLGLLSDEGGSWLGGYGMTEDNRLMTIATLSDFWDGKTVQINTAGEGFTPLRGRRLTFHLMIQPILSGRLLGNAEAAGQGFLSRLLVAHPPSLAGQRFVDPSKRRDQLHDAALTKYKDRLKAIVAAKLPIDPDTQLLRPRLIALSAQAESMWWAFYNAIEAKLGPDGELQQVKGFVGKLPEMAARLAANIAGFDLGGQLHEINAEHLARGIKLAEFYLGEAVRLFGHGSPSEEMQDAQVLSDWLRRKWSENLISVTAIQQKGPGQVRKGGDHVKALIDILVRHDHLSQQLPNGGMVSGKHARAVWRVMVKDEQYA